MSAAAVIPAVSAGLGALAGLFGGNPQKAAVEEQARQFNANTALATTRLQSNEPMRQRLMAILGHLSQNPAARFVPHDIYGTGGTATPSLGGRPQDAYQTPAGFQLDQGPMNTYEQIMDRMGYSAANNTGGPRPGGAPSPSNSPYTQSNPWGMTNVPAPFAGTGPGATQQDRIEAYYRNNPGVKRPTTGPYAPLAPAAPVGQNG